MRLLISMLALTLTSCGQSVVTEATQASIEGRVIDNDIMRVTYPNSFKSGSPPYLERDFEAGADFICDEMQIELGYDICSSAEINWR